MHANDPTAGQFHNAGYEHLKSIYHLKEAQAKAPLQAASAYILPLMALQSARLAIEEYVNRTGQDIDSNWDESDRKVIPIQERIARIYGITGHSLNFKTGIWKEVLSLCETAELLRGDLSKMRKLQRNEIPEEFKDIAVEYPIYRSQAITEEAINLLLDLADLDSPLKGDATLAK